MSATTPMRLLLLMAGPKFDLEWEFGERLDAMSAFSCGDVMTTSSKAGELTAGAFTIRSMVVGRRKRLIDRIRYFRACYGLLREARSSGSPVSMIVAYDPLVTGITAVVLSRIFRTKLCVEINGDYSAPANYAHIDSAAKRAWKKAMAIRLARFTLRRADAVKLLFDEQLERLSFVLKSGQVVRCFPNYVHTTAFSNIANEPTVLLVGFPMHVKGTDIAIRAFRQIEDEFPDWSLNILGFYPDRTQLDQLIDGSTQISVLKPVLHRNVNEHVGRCGILLQPSRTEGMGRVLIEAMSAGKPIIATRIDGIPGVVEDQVSGILVAPDDVQATADALKKLMSDPEVRKRMGDAGERKVASGFAGASYFQELQSMYEEVVGAR